MDNDIHRSTQSGDCSSSRWCSRRTMMWETCSRYLVSTTCSWQSSWMFCCWDLLKIFSRVWFTTMKIKFVLLCYVIILLDFSLILVSLLKMFALKCLILSVKFCQSLLKLERMKRTRFVSYLVVQILITNSFI